MNTWIHGEGMAPQSTCHVYTMNTYYLHNEYINTWHEYGSIGICYSKSYTINTLIQYLHNEYINTRVTESIH